MGAGQHVEGVMDGPSPTFEDFVASRGRDLWRTAWLLTGDAHKAEDLVQTTLAKCWSRWSSITRSGNAEAYVRRAMINTYTDWWRRKWNGERPTETLPETAVRQRSRPREATNSSKVGLGLSMTSSTWWPGRMVVAR